MKCKCCGAEIPNDVSVCPACDTAVKTEEKVVIQPVVVQPVVQEETVQTAVQNPLVGKQYQFRSVRGTRMGLFNDRIISQIEVGEDRLFIQITPKRFQTAPAILFEDITGIEISTKISLYYWGLIIISIVAAFLNPFMLICTVLFVICGRQKKITISQRSGVNVVVYDKGNETAEQFKNDMKMVTIIQ